MAADLDELLNAVCDEKSFLAFVDALATDFAEAEEIEKTMPSNPCGPNARGWENTTVDAVLDAAVRWGDATLTDPRPEIVSPNPWHRCAFILFAGKFYE